MERINVIYCVDTKLFYQQLVSLISLAKNTKSALNVINLTVEVPQLTKKSKKTTEAQTALFDEILKKANPLSSYTTVDVSKEFVETLLKGPNVHNKFYSYFVTVRLVADLVKEVPDEKALYLDSDTIFIGDVKDLYDIDLKGAFIGGRKDKFRIKNYFQSGVMLLDMKQIRENGLLEKSRELVTNKKYFCYIDMSALNTACKKRYMIPKKLISFDYDKRAIVHHVCDTRESKILLTKKWWHRIKPDEKEYMVKIYPEYAYIYEEIEKYEKTHEEAFKG